MTEEDEAFNDIERQAKQRKESVRAAVQTLSEYERGFIDGMQKQMQSSVDKAVNAMSQRTWVGLTDGEIRALAKPSDDIAIPMTGRMWIFVGDLMNKLKEKNT
jgi:hypothetical protein